MVWAGWNTTKKPDRLTCCHTFQNCQAFRLLSWTNVHGMLSARDQLQQLREKQKAESQSSLRISLNCWMLRAKHTRWWNTLMIMCCILSFPQISRIFRQWLCFIQIVMVNKTFTDKNPFILFEYLYNKHKTRIQIWRRTRRSSYRSNNENSTRNGSYLRDEYSGGW